MNIRDMQTIIAIAEEKNITRAAQKIYTSQPALSQTLKKVEAELGASLFIRTVDGLTPTYIGEKFIETTLEIVSIYKKLELFVTEVQDLHVGQLCIGVPSYLSGSFLSEVLPLYSVLYPAIEVTVEQQKDLELEHLLTHAKVDMVIGLSDAISNKFHKELIFKCRLLLSVPPNFPLEQEPQLIAGDKYPTLDIEGMKGIKILDFDKVNPLHHMAHLILEQNHVEFESKSLLGYGVEMVRRCSQSGMGFTIIPECSLSSKFTAPTERYFYIKNDIDVRYMICAAWLSENQLPMSAQRLLQISRQHLNGTN